MKMNDFESWLNAVRVELFEGTKGLTDQEVVDASNENGRKIGEKYGIEIVKIEPSLE